MPMGGRAAVVPAGAIGARLLAIGGLFAVAVLLEVAGRAPYSERTLTALYALVLAGFLATLGYGLAASQRAGRFPAWLELTGDGVLISGLVYCTGGSRSVFAFLYVVWIVYAALRGGTRAALVAPVVAAGSYAVIGLGLSGGWLPALEPGEAPAPGEVISAIGSHALAFLLVAALALRLAREVGRGQRELRELGELHRRIFDNVSSGLLTTDVHGRITSFNPEAERITGWIAAEMIGAPLVRLFPEPGMLPGAASSESAPALPEGPASRLRCSFTNREGELLHLGLSRSLLRDADGAPEGSVLIFQDLTRVVEMEEELRRSERLAAVGQLAAGLAHEVRNPLASLSGAIELLERDLPELGPSATRLIRIVKRETARLNRLVSDFLAYARPGSKRRERVWLRELLLELEQLVESGEPGRIRLELDVSEELAVDADPDQLLQVFWNLVLNAVQAEPEDGIVRLRAARAAPEESERDAVEVEVCDRGVGIPPEVLDRIMEPFFTTKPKGAGLGLATVHRAVEAHGGSLQIRSEIGHGTSVRLLLPAAGA
jgi:two-component system sensor histidine kinase PilS (NtrC family)